MRPFGIALLLSIAALAGCTSPEPLRSTDESNVVHYDDNDSGSQSSLPQTPPPPPPPAPPTPPPAVPANRTPVLRVTVQVVPGEVLASVSAGAADLTPHATAGNATNGTFVVGNNARAVLAELVWLGDATDLDLFLGASDASAAPLGFGGSGHRYANTAGDPTAPDRPARILVNEVRELAGTWSYEIGGKGAPQTRFTLYVSVFYDGDVPEEYSAIPSA